MKSKNKQLPKFRIESQISEIGGDFKNEKDCFMKKKKTKIIQSFQIFN